MFYKSYQPSVPLSEFIDEYVIICYDDKKDHLSKDKFIPRPGGGMLFHFRDPAKLLDGNKTIEFPRVFITTQQSKFVVIEPGQNSDVLIVRFKPWGIYNLFNISPKEFTCGHEDASLLFGGKICRLFEQMAEEKNIGNRINHLESFLIGEFLLLSPGKNNKTVRFAIDKIIESRGCIRINELCTLFPTEERTLRRNFLTQTGIGAKSFSRIIKFNNIISELMRNPTVEMLDIVARYGYTDQTHFINDFKEIYGETPAVFVKRDKVNTQTISALK